MDEFFLLIRELPVVFKILLAVFLGGIIFSILKKVVKTLILLIIIVAVYFLLEKYIFL